MLNGLLHIGAYHKRYIFLAMQVFAFGMLLVGCRGNKEPSSIPVEAPSIDTSKTQLAFVSDTQAPLWVETLVLQRDRNEEATEAIFTALSQEPNVAALFHLGDITVAGSWKSEWEPIDTYLSMLDDAGIPVFPVPGNHDYYLFPRRSKELFHERFPYCNPTWYSTTIEGIAVVLVNSNLSRLSDQDRKEQQRWYEATLAALERDTTVQSIVVGTHHSPYTNSTIVNPSQDVQRAFVPAFHRNSKCKVFLSGHAHAFEHFRVQGKDFLVIGGGGGLLHPLLRVEKARWKDLFPSDSKRRMFHYLLCEQYGDSFRLTIKMINPDYRSFGPVYELAIGEDT